MAKGDMHELAMYQFMVMDSYNTNLKKDEKTMQIIVVGCGKVGTALTAQLSKEDNNVTVVDLDPNVVQNISSTYDVMGITGNGASYSVLSEADLEHTDLLIAVTESDERNLLCCVIAKKVGHCQTIARVRDPIYIHERHFIKDELGLSMIINPEFAAALVISRLLRLPSAIEIDTFAKGRVEILRFRIPNGCSLHDMTLKDIPAQMGCDILICAVERGNEVMIPSGDFTLHSQDIISFVATPRNAGKFLQLIQLRTNRVKNTIIIGGGELSVYLANLLLKMGIAVKIIEIDAKRCEELSNLLPKASIIHGDGSDEELLWEERIDQADSLVALTGFDEENILLSLFAKGKVRSKVVTKINRLKLNEVIHNLDLDSVVYPKHITAESILQYVRAMKNSIGSNVETLYKLIDDKVEALEFYVHGKSKITNVPLEHLNIKPNILICCITRNEHIIIPGGQDVITPGDTVIVVSTLSGLEDIQDILQDSY